MKRSLADLFFAWIYLNWNVWMVSPSNWMNVLSWANRNVFCSRFSSKDNSTLWSLGWSDTVVVAAVDVDASAAVIWWFLALVGSTGAWVSDAEGCEWIHGWIRRFYRKNDWNLLASPAHWLKHSASVLNRFNGLPLQPPHTKVVHSLVALS